MFITGEETMCFENESLPKGDVFRSFPQSVSHATSRSCFTKKLSHSLSKCSGRHSRFPVWFADFIAYCMDKWNISIQRALSHFISCSQPSLVSLFGEEHEPIYFGCKRGFLDPHTLRYRCLEQFGS